MASFFRTTFDSFLNNLNFTQNTNNPRGPSQPQHNTTNSRPPGHQSDNWTSFFAPNGGYSRGRTSSNQRNTNSRSGLAPNQSQNQRPNQQQAGHHQAHQQPTNMSTNPTQNPLTRSNDKLDISDIRDLNDISKLSAKELKTILTRNCVDYKGVFEKEVLREKVMQLWIDYNEKRARRRHNRAKQTQDPTANRSQTDSSDEIDENQLCKICMEREINCVLLECGHYLTCVTCGRKLAECPICRQNITRCVRTFKG